MISQIHFLKFNFYKGAFYAVEMCIYFLFARLLEKAKNDWPSVNLTVCGREYKAVKSLPDDVCM